VGSYDENAGGAMLMITRRHGFAYRGWPRDFWRYDGSDVKQSSSDCGIEGLEAAVEPGVLPKARKPADFAERDLSDVKLYSILADSKVRNIAAAKLGKSSRSIWKNAGVQASSALWIKRKANPR
jgi:hypothetical protein